MPALACVDAAIDPVRPPGYGFAWEGALPEPVAAAFAVSGGSLTTDASDCIASPWSTDLSAALYKIDGWGPPYFAVNSAGNISVRPYGASTLPHQEIDLMKVVKRATDSKSTGGLGLPLPLVVRFPDVLKNRLESLHSAFNFAIQSTGYCSRYQGVYPVKCNQDRHIVEDIVEFGAPFGFGLEAGSKPELLLAMSCLVRAGSPEAFLVCNGYKDEEYIELALLGRSLGINTVIVLEQEEELDLVIETSRRLNIRPVIGFRAKLRTKHSGHFGSTSGEKGKFGLNTTQILSVAWKLKQVEMLDCLQLLHFHIGSQIPSTSLLSDGVGEAAQIYCELARLGAGMRVMDIGGGLGIDYDGSHSGGSDMSVAYGLDEYAAAVVQAVKFACDRKNVPHPVICSESGRALVSHHSILIFEAVSASGAAAATPSSVSNFACFLNELVDDARSSYINLMNAAVQGDLENCAIYTDQLKRSCVEQFRDGVLSLEHLAAVDGVCEWVAQELGVANSVKTYNVNLSIFTSIPDFWAIGQLFPIVPIHRLDERPVVNGILSDLTCDSDGKVDQFIGGQSSLPLHELNGRSNADGGYYLGMFLGGAYQEALGGMHNLFGGPSVVRVKQSDGPHCFAVTLAMPGPSSADVLRAMQHEPELMFECLKHRAEEYSDSLDGGEEVSCAFAHAFSSMPYLVCGRGGGEVLVSDSDTDSSGALSAEQEEEDWEFIRCLSV